MEPRDGTLLRLCEELSQVSFILLDGLSGARSGREEFAPMTVGVLGTGRELDQRDGDPFLLQEPGFESRHDSGVEILALHPGEDLIVVAEVDVELQWAQSVLAGARLAAHRLQVLGERLEAGFSVEDLCRAVVGCIADADQQRPRGPWDHHRLRL